MATLTSTCSLPTAARLCQTEINYPGESHCYSKAPLYNALCFHKLYFYQIKKAVFFHLQVGSFCLSASFSSYLLSTYFISSHLSIYTLLFTQLFHLFLFPVNFSTLRNNNVISGVAKITSAFYILLCFYSLCSSAVCSLSIIPEGGGKKKQTEILPLTHI